MEIILQRHGGTDPADILCLQEVDHFADFFHPALYTLGYQGVISLGSGYDPSARNGGYTMGTAVFWRVNTFDLVDDYTQDIGIGRVVLIRLRHRIRRNDLLVCGVHLGSGDRVSDEDYRSTQLDKILQRLEQSDLKDLPTVFLGDFNADTAIMKGETSDVPTKCVPRVLEFGSFVSAYPLAVTMAQQKSMATTMKFRSGKDAIQIRPGGIRWTRANQGTSSCLPVSVGYCV